jgi:ABC-type lipoprotein release transport system permease subunit
MTGRSTTRRRHADVSRTTALVIAGICVACRNPKANRASVLEVARRLNGDVTLIHMSSSFTNFESVQSSILKDGAVQHASLIATWPAQLIAGPEKVSAVLKLEQLQEWNAHELSLRTDELPTVRSAGVEPSVALGEILASRVHASPGDYVTVMIRPGEATATTATVRCKVVSIVKLGVESFDRKLILADLSHLSTFSLDPGGLEIRLFEPVNRTTFAQHLEAELGAGFRAIPLEELIAPLLDAKSAAPR